MSTFTKTVLFSDTDGRARFREESLLLDQGNLQSALSALRPSGGYQLRSSPVVREERGGKGLDHRRRPRRVRSGLERHEELQVRCCGGQAVRRGRHG